MVTILVVEDEKKAQEMLHQMLLREGYANPLDLEKVNFIKVIKKETIRDKSSLAEMVLELENSFYKEKEGLLYKSVLEVIEKPMLESVLQKTEGNQVKAAKILGINRNTLRSKIKKLGIQITK